MQIILTCAIEHKKKRLHAAIVDDSVSYVNFLILTLAPVMHCNQRLEGAA
jgi:hypothetical protein